MSEIFRYNVERLSTSELFKSEHQMESFLYNNPQIFGKLMEEGGDSSDPAITQQFSTQKSEVKKGRIDLMVLTSSTDGIHLLKIIELKLKAKKEDFSQLKDYLIGLNDKNEFKNKIIEFIKEEGKIEDKDIAEDCYNNPQGIFIVSDFEPDIINKINEWNINGLKDKTKNNPIELYKLLKFKTKESTYVVLDKIIEVISKIRKKRFDFSWKDFADNFDEIRIGDIFYIDKKYTKEDEIEFKITDQRKLVTLTSETIELLRKNDYFRKSKEFGSNYENLLNFQRPKKLATDDFPRMIWNYKPFNRIFSLEINVEDVSHEKIAISNLVQLVLLANELSQTGWVWSTKIIHKKTNKNYLYYREELKKSKKT